MKRISVAIATYNGEKYLRQQLDSLFSQERIPDEVIVSDDNSSDNTVSILEDYRANRGIKYIVNKTALGVNKNFEQAIRSCTGDYIMICDQDDIWLPNKISSSLRYMQKLEEKWGVNCPVLITSEVTSFEDGERIVFSQKNSDGVILNYRDFLFSSNQHCQGCTMMMNRVLLNRIPSFPNSFRHYPYDAHIAIISLLIGKRCHLRQELMYYRHHDNNVVVSLKRKPSLVERLYEKLSPLVYSFYGIPFPRQMYYWDVINNLNITINDEAIKRDVSEIVSFARSGFIGKIKAIIAISEIDNAIKKRQLFETVLLYPLRLITPKPRV